MNPPAIGAIAVVLLMIALWIRQLKTENAGWVDVGWAASTGGLGLYYAASGDGAWPHRVVVGVMGGVWGLRLITHLVPRLRNRPEEDRYRNLRRNWGEKTNSRMFVLFVAQAAIALMLSLPFWLTANRAEPALQQIEWIGMAIWLVGLVGEAIADRQLQAFKEKPAEGKRVCNVGLWRYSRHPNYFFEWILWCGVGVLSLGTPGGVLGLAAPLLMLWLLTSVTGIPPAERQSLSSRGESYRRYMQETSPFFPWFVRATHHESAQS